MTSSISKIYGSNLKPWEWWQSGHWWRTTPNIMDDNLYIFVIKTIHDKNKGGTWQSSVRPLEILYLPVVSLTSTENTYDNWSSQSSLILSCVCTANSAYRWIRAKCPKRCIHHYGMFHICRVPKAILHTANPTRHWSAGKDKFTVGHCAGTRQSVCRVPPDTRQRIFGIIKKN